VIAPDVLRRVVRDAIETHASIALKKLLAIEMKEREELTPLIDIARTG